MRRQTSAVVKKIETSERADRSAELARAAHGIATGDPRRIAASIAMFEQLSEHWALRGEERETLLGGISKSTWSEWKQRPLSARVKPDTRERIANLFTIDLTAHSLFAPEFADRWLRQPNAAFGEESAISVMMRGKVEDIVSVRRYLERIRTSSPPLGNDSIEETSEVIDPAASDLELIETLEWLVNRVLRRGDSQIGDLDRARAKQPSEPDVYVRIAKTLVNMGDALSQAGRNDAALAAYGEVIAHFRGETAPELSIQVATALVNQGTILGQLGQNEKELAAYDEVIARFKDAVEPELRESVTAALSNRADTLGQLGRLEEALKAYEAAIARRFPDLTSIRSESS